MAEAVLLAVKLVFLTEFHLDGVRARAAFSDNTAGTLLASHKDFGYYTEVLGNAYARKEPVGAALVSGSIEEVVPAREGTPIYIADANNERITVRFQEHAAMYALKKDNPEFGRIFDLLERSRLAKVRLWFVVRGPRPVIDDAAPFVR